MGQAKQRGSLEQRVALGIIRRLDRERVKVEKTAIVEANLTPKQRTARDKARLLMQATSALVNKG